MKAGDRVMLRTPAEILSTLDERGSLEGLPFMPEMLPFFGKPFVVTARVGRACDTIHYSGVRRLDNTVILDDLRCDGTGHSGCQAECRLYWKEAWLRLASPSERSGDVAGSGEFLELERIARANVHSAESTAETPLFRCQATTLLEASHPVGWWSLRSFAHELTGGNVGLWRFTRAMTRIVIEEIARRVGLIDNRAFRPRERTGELVETPIEEGLRPGDLVQIRPRHEIAQSVGENGKTRGLWFDREMVPYCGQTARVRSKVERFVDETSGRMIELKSDCYILDNVVCESYRSSGRWFCPRAIYPWWRETWLRPLEGESTNRAPDKHAD
jgi:hypothetical protein